MKETISWPEWLVLGLLVMWRTIYAYWTPLVNRYLVPPGDDPVYHIGRVNDFLTGHGRWLVAWYPGGFHFLVALIARLAHWDALTAIRLIGPALLVLPIVSLYWSGRLIWRSSWAGTFAAAMWVLLALGPIRAFGDGTYPNLLASSFLLPLVVTAMVLAVRTPSHSRTIILIVLILLLASIHHLTLVTLGLALACYLIDIASQIARHLYRRRARRQLVFQATIGLFILAALLAIGSHLRPFIAYVLTTPNTVTRALNWSTYLEINNPLFLYLTLLSLLVFVFVAIRAIDDNDQRSLLVLFTGWVGLLLLATFTPYFSFPGRFAREIAVPGALLTGWFLSTLLTINRERRIAGIAFVILLLIIGWDVGQSFHRPFALPDPFGPLIRVQHDEEAALPALERITPPDSTILANTGDLYLPYLVHRPVSIVQLPKQLPTLSRNRSIRTVVLVARPPLTPSDVAVPYASFDAVTHAMEGLPDLQLVWQLPSGTRLYHWQPPAS